MLGTAGDEAPALLGRDEERRLLGSLLDEVAVSGQSLVLRGEPGVGKSRLLSDAVRSARERGMLVLTTTGVQSRSGIFRSQVCISSCGRFVGAWRSCPRLSARRWMPRSA